MINVAEVFFKSFLQYECNNNASLLFMLDIIDHLFLIVHSLFRLALLPASTGKLRTLTSCYLAYLPIKQLPDSFENLTMIKSFTAMFVGLNQLSTKCPNNKK